MAARATRTLGNCEHCKNLHQIPKWNADRECWEPARFCGDPCKLKAWNARWEAKHGEPYSRWYKRRLKEKTLALREKVLQQCALAAEERTETN